MTTSSRLAEKRVLLGVTGGIAAYKSPDLVRRLREAGAEVQVVMTGGARRFVSEHTFQAVSGRRVRTDLWDAEAEAAMGHIELARWADHVLVAPATADFLARLAHGFADDLLTTLCLATEAPVTAAPAMNRVMWASAATRDNCALLERRGVTLLGPGEGELAEGESGPGRMLEPTEIVDALADAELADPVETAARLQGVRVVVTAGPTREPIDPVRYVTNRSSGRMGFAVADAAARAGARVTLIAGPVTLETPSGVERVDVDTAEEMQRAVTDRLAECDVFIGVAAVADYRPARRSKQKVKKRKETLDVEMERTPDILSGVAAKRRPPFTVGFAAETEDLVANARAKLEAKKLDMVAANLVDDRGHGFDAEDNALHVLWRGGEQALPSQSKRSLAAALIDLVARRYAEHRNAA